MFIEFGAEVCYDSWSPNCVAVSSFLSEILGEESKVIRRRIVFERDFVFRISLDNEIYNIWFVLLEVASIGISSAISLGFLYGSIVYYLTQVHRRIYDWHTEMMRIRSNTT